MSDILILQNTKHEGLAHLGQILIDDGFKIKSVLVKNEKIPRLDHSALIILGGPQSANDDTTYINDEMSLIKDAVKRSIPVLGICLGSQLIAKTFGANVYKGSEKEIGFYHDLEFDNLGDSTLFSAIKSPMTVFHWHAETFDLPEGATRLVHSKKYANQAIQYGTAVGLQFHLEVDEHTIKLWAQNSKEMLKKIPYIEPQKIIVDISKYLKVVENNMRIFYRNFKKEFNL